MAATYVEITDLDTTYDTKTHPTLVQVNKYLERANRLLSSYLTGENVSDVYGGIKEAGIVLTEILIYNRKVKDGVPGYQYSKRFAITDEIKGILQSETFGDYGKFTFDPTTRGFGSS